MMTRNPDSCRAPHALAAALALAAMFAALLGGCASSAGIVPTSQPIAPASLGLGVDAARSASAPRAADWWQGLGDPALDQLVARALASSPTLKTAQARLVRADAALAGARAAEGVRGNATLDVTRQRFSENSIYPPPLGGSTRTLATAQVAASWELDFFGRHRAAIEAALGSQRAAGADIQAARLLLASRVAHAYVQLGRLLEQRSIAARALQQRSDMLGLITQRVKAGLDTTVEQRQGEGALPETRQQIELLDEQIMLARHALAALTAQAPGELDALVPALARLQPLPLPGALPVDLLGRRADVAAARWRAEAARHEIDSARAQFYPNIDLGAFAGLSSIGLDRLVQVGSTQLGVGPAIRLPLFNEASLRAGLQTRTADFDAALESYNAVVIDAVHDAADQIDSLRSIERQQREQAQAQSAAESAYDLSTQRYRAGLGTYLVVLNAEATVLNQRRQAADLKARALDTQIALVHAIGGGYSDTRIESHPGTAP
jgi:NodT family efflux transporter outer membrane factor (OMF) lipoprotein